MAKTKKKSSGIEFDYKQFLLEKGERVGLGIAIGVMGLLLVGGILKCVGASPSQQANKIDAAAKTVNQGIMTSRLPEDDKKVPADLLAAVSPKAVDPDVFAIHLPWFTPSALEDTKWREPEILALGPAIYDVVQAPIAKNAINSETGQVLVRKSADGSSDKKDDRLLRGLDKDMAKRIKKQQRQFERMQRYMNRGAAGAGGKGGGGGGGGMMGGPPGGGMGMMGGPPGMGGGMFGGPPGMGGGMMGGRGNGGTNPMMSMMQQMRGMMGNPANAGKGFGGSGEKWELTSATIDDAVKNNLQIARVAVPVTEAVICAEFPYKKQMEAIRKALRYPSVDAMLSDSKVWLNKDDKQHPATINFLGFEIERQAIGPDGRIVQPFTKIDLETPYRLVRQWDIDKRNDDDATLRDYGLIVTDVPSRLVWPLPPLMREEEKYPNPLDKLPELKQTLKKRQEEGKPKEKTDTKNPYEQDPFEENDTSAGGSGPGPMKGMMPPSGTMPPNMGGPGGAMSGNGGDMQQRMKQMQQGMKMAAQMMGKGGGGKGGGLTSSAERHAELPDWVLVRFLDVTVQPGLTYQYKVRLKLANPLYNRKELAVTEEAARRPEIVGPAELLTTRKNGQKATLNVRVPASMYVYAVDEKPAHQRYVIPADKDRAAVQIHHWLDALQVNRATRLPVGEWIIAQRELVRRGEYIGQSERVEVPVWDPREDKFLFATADENGKRRSRRHKGVTVDFSTQSLLVDFEGGKKNETLNNHNVSDKAPVELLIMTPDGRLVVRNQATDTANKERKDRLKAFQKLEDDVKQAMDESQDNQKGAGGKTNPFNFGGGKGR